MKRSTAMVVALVAGLLVAACGSSGGSSGSSAQKTIDKPTYVSEANAICKKGNAALAVSGKQVKATDESAVETYVKTIFVPGVRGQITAIQALGYPAGDEVKLKAIYAQTLSILDKIDKDPKTFVEASGDPFTPVDPKLTAYGLSSCGSSGS